MDLAIAARLDRHRASNLSASISTALFATTDPNSNPDPDPHSVSDCHTDAEHITDALN